MPVTGLVASYLKYAGYIKVPGKRRYIDPTGTEISRRQAEQRSGALQALYGEPTREKITRYTRPSGKATREDAARDYKRHWQRKDAATTIVRKDPFFRHQWGIWKDRSLPFQQRAKAASNFGWFHKIDYKWRYVRFGL